MDKQRNNAALHTSSEQVSLLLAHELALVAEGHGGVYTYVNTDRESNVTMNPTGVTNSANGNFTDLDTGVAIHVDRPIQLAGSDCYACTPGIPDVARLPVAVALDSPLAFGEKLIVVVLANGIAIAISIPIDVGIVTPLRRYETHTGRTDLMSPEIRTYGVGGEIQHGFNSLYSDFVFQGVTGSSIRWWFR